MSDLVSRLRSFGGDQPFANEIERLAFEAAAEITRLQKEVETAREDALEEAAQHFASDGAYGAWHSQSVASELRRLKDKEVAG